jgi:hypothetical protein
MRTVFIGLALAMMIASVAAAAPSTPRQYVRKTSGPVLSLAADGDRAAFLVEGRVKECWSVMVWEPGHRRVHRLQSAAKCESTDRLNRRGTPTVALAGTRVAWLLLTGGNNLETIVLSATLARPKPVSLAYGAAADGIAGTFVRRPFGDRSLLAFTTETRCHPDYGEGCPPDRQPLDITEATVWRVTRGRGSCGNGECAPVKDGESELSVLAVDAGRLAVRTQTGLRLFTAAGRVLRDIKVGPRAAALSGNRLVARTETDFEVYDIRTGELTARIPAANLRLQDLERDILVTASSETVTLRRLGNGRTSTIRAGRFAFAQLEPSGLFLAGSRRVTFTPMRDVLRRLGG